MREAEHVLDVQNRLGEGPIWNAEEQALYWVDIESHLFYRYFPAEGRYERFDAGLPVGVLAFREAGGLVMATRDGFALWDMNTRSLTFVANTEADKVEARFNDGAVDRQGNFWAGTMCEGASSSLYRLAPDYSVRTMETGITICNGIGWSPDNRTMYFTDTLRKVIYAYDFDPMTSEISNRRDFVRVPDGQGVPDGLAVDSEGFVWSARWGGSRIVRHDPEGRVESEVHVPATQVTSCAFGGPDLTDLYITTAWTGLSDEERARQPLAGDLFLLRADVPGAHESKFRG